MVVLYWQAKLELEMQVSDLEKYRDQVSERRDAKEELEAFSTQELTKVKHLVCSCASVRMIWVSYVGECRHKYSYGMPWVLYGVWPLAGSGAVSK